MTISLFILATLMTITPQKLDFHLKSQDNNWYAVNDGVMGGLSEGTITYNDQSMVFKGRTSLKNNGGFASIRSPYQDWNIQNYKGIKIRVKSTNSRKFGFVLETRAPFYYPTYKTLFATSPNEWKTIDMPIEDFIENRMGNPTGKKIPTRIMPNIERLGIILFDKQAGEFELEIDYIELY